MTGVPRRAARGIVVAVLMAAALQVAGVHAASVRPLSPADAARPAPAFGGAAEDWIGSAPLRWDALEGKVVLLDFWTFACFNCFRSFPWLNALERAYGPRGLQVIGIHTPEFDFEQRRENVEAKMAEYGLHHPVMQDNAHRYWNAIGNRYWPAFYLIDKQGRIRALYVGETHVGDAQAQAIARDVEALLAEP